MAVREETAGQTIQCEGCGRVDAGPGAPLDIRPFVVRDPNLASDVTHHYCGGCAANRGYAAARLEFGWTPAPVPAFAPNETKDQRSAREDAHGPFIPGAGEDSLGKVK